MNEILKQFKASVDHSCQEKNKPYFSFEITTTHCCTMRCDYCFELDRNSEPLVLNDKLPLIIRRIEALMAQPWFTETYAGMTIGFWGGEPTINIKAIREVVNHFKLDERIHYHIYSNGYIAANLIDLLVELKPSGVLKRFPIQFSYDGLALHNKHRKGIYGEDTAAAVMANAKCVLDLGIEISFKSTITPPDFKYMPEIWDEFAQLYDEFDGGDRKRRPFNYTPTIDYFHEYDPNMEEFEKAIAAICKREIDFFYKTGHHLLGWIDGKKPVCSAGENMLVIDVDGIVYRCHGCLYDQNKNDLKVTSLDASQDEFLYSIYQCHSELKGFTNKTSEDCKYCVATACYKCNVVKYGLSTKSSAIERWYDYRGQPELCTYFKLFGKMNRALRQLIMEDKRHGL